MNPPAASLDTFPADFIQNIQLAFGMEGRRWLERLPSLLEEAARRWNLAVGDPFLLSYNYVCAATLKDGSEAVLKIGVPNRELTGEINALGLYHGQGACQMLEAEPEKGMLLLERLQPGTMLAALEDDDRATEFAAEVLKAIQRPAPQPEGFISLRGWFDELKKLRLGFGGGTGPFPEKSFTTAEGLIGELFAEQCPQVLLHGDFHHYNILLSGRGWLAIDPKGVIGPAEYEVGPLLINPYHIKLDENEAIRRTERRIAILSERLGFEAHRLRSWAICHSVLSAFWDMAEDGTGGESARAWTEIFLKIKV
jgi:streptomycin 6-kinase